MKIMESPIRVVVADDHPLVRAGLRLFVESDPGLAVVAEAGCGQSAIAAVLCHRPDLLLLDTEMPDTSGVELIRSVKRASSAVRILALVTFSDELHEKALLNAGAEGCSSKCADCGELLQALRAVASMPSVGDERVSSSERKPLDDQSDTGDAPGRHLHRRRGSSRHGETLTPRELDVLKLAGRGYNNRAIGLQLGISSRTVQGYLASAYHRLHVGSRTQAVTRAVKMGCFSLDLNDGRVGPIDQPS